MILWSWSTECHTDKSIEYWLSVSAVSKVGWSLCRLGSASCMLVKQNAALDETETDIGTEAIGCKYKMILILHCMVWYTKCPCRQKADDDDVNLSSWSTQQRSICPYLWVNGGTFRCQYFSWMIQLLMPAISEMHLKIEKDWPCTFTISQPTAGGCFQGMNSPPFCAQYWSTLSVINFRALE